MKKLMCLALGVSMIGAMIVVAGCGGGSGGLGAILGAAFVIAIVASTGGAGGGAAVPFAASLRERPAIRGLAIPPISAGSLQFKVTPLTANGVEGTPQYFDVATSSIPTEVVGTASMNVSGTEYRVELVRKADGVALLKNVLIADDLDTNPNVSTTVNASTTAAVLVYTEWLKSNTIDGSFINFLAGIGDASASIALIGTNIQNDFAIDGVASLSNYTADALSTANQVSNVFNNQSIKGWWLLTPTSNEYAAFYNLPSDNSTSTGIITNTSDFFYHAGSYLIQPNGSLGMELISMEGQSPVVIRAMATMTSTIAATYAAYQGNTLEESGTAVKVSNPAACAGTWTGTADGDTFTVVIDPNGFIQSFEGPEADSLPAYVAETNGVKNGFVVSEGGKVAGFARFSDDAGTRVRFFGTISGTTFTGTIESASVEPTADLPNGAISMTKSSN
ncbi:hypothetical protein KBA41_14430 [Candidatus Ozemobacteraceae bacterium]|nr:hypothetical protein [Candidatus Ozemobacteraceae bacterium]